MAPLKLHYFELPGRGEVAHLCLTIGNVPYETVTYEFKTWSEHKAKMPFGQVPVLEVDGKMLAQSGAIDRYVAKLAGLYPEDPWQAALADQVTFHMADIWELFVPTFKLSTTEEKIKARQEILATKVKGKMEQLSKLLESSGEYVAGDKLSFGDLAVFVSLSNLISGFLDGVPLNLLDDYPALKAYRNKIASLPAVKEFYEKNGTGLRAAFKADAAA